MKTLISNIVTHKSELAEMLERYGIKMDDTQMAEDIPRMIQLLSDLLWAAEKLASVRSNYVGNAPFTTEELDRLIRLVGLDRFHRKGRVL